MGTKKSRREVPERQKLNNEVNPLMDEDSSFENIGKGFVSNDDQTSRHGANDVAFNLEGDANLKNHEIGKKKKKNKRKSDHIDADVETQKVREQDGVGEEDGSDGNERGKLGKNIRGKVPKHGSGIDSAENGAREGMSRAKDGKKDKKKRKKQQREKHVGDTEVTGGTIDGKKAGNERENIMDKVAKNGGGMDSSENEAGEGMSRAKDGKKDEKRRKKRKRERDGDTGVISNGIDGKEAGTETELLGENILENVEPSRKKRKKKNKHNVDLEDAVEKIMDNKLCNENCMAEEFEGCKHPFDSKVGNAEIGEHISSASSKVKKKKKKKKVESEKNSLEVKGFSGTEQKSGNEMTDASVRSTPKGASKRVSFSEDVEIFPSSDDLSDEGSVQKKELVRGKRFSLEEDEMVKVAVLNYIDQHALGEEGLNMILKCKKYPAVRNCWKEIGAALPWRPCESVYHRAHVLFERDETRKWTEEEYELVRKFHEKYGANWKTLGDALGKHRFHVKDAWRRINVANRKRGKWSQDEYQSLFDLVNMDLRMKAFEERRSKHGMLRDNISWTAISNKMGSRATAMCCMKWYDSLTSPLVAEGKWLDVDDYRLLLALYEVDAGCMEDVEWDSLLEHRPGDVCRKRWNQMVKHLGELQNGSFADQVEVLMKRYCPDVLEAREAYNSKPIVD